ncbi:MAG: HDIG domain-containing protein [Bacteroidaceae bacterium]|nr:HDIG domain-containing protein [Bacteroidaceae bacterium]
MLLLLYFVPRSSSNFTYEYSEDKPWRYATLIAEFDFPVLRSKVQQQYLYDSIQTHFQPYYSKVDSVGTRNILAFEQDVLQGKITGVSSSCIVLVRDLLNAVYEQGIVQPDTYLQLSQIHPRGIRLINANQASSLPLDSVLTTRTAYEWIMSVGSNHYFGKEMSRCNLNHYLQANLVEEKTKNELELNEEKNAIGQYIGLMQAGQSIITQGDIVTHDKALILESFKHELSQRGGTDRASWWVLGGQFILLLLVYGALATYIYLFRRDYLLRYNIICLLLTLVTLFPVLGYILKSNFSASLYLIPFAIVPMFVRIFVDSRTALVAAVLTTALASVVANNAFEFVLVQLFVSFTTIYALKELTARSQIVRVAFLNILVGWAMCLSYDLMNGLVFNNFDEVRNFDFSRYIYLAINGGLLLLAYPIMYFIESIFGFTSSVRLIELMNFNAGLLDRMSKEAQGTFNHSIQVSNLAAAVARKIGAKPLLARAGGLYHDIGKMKNPAFFTENQKSMNPHNSLKEEESAQIIISHVKNGLRLASEYNLPQEIKDFITTHHGLGTAKYFAIQWQNKHPEEPVDTELFSYPGPNPFTAEQAILMMCDSVEAASRSLKEYTEESISTLVNNIIDSQLSEGYFKNSPITFRDIEMAKETLIENLKTTYHTRIAYPQLQSKENGANTPNQPSVGRVLGDWFGGRNGKQRGKRKRA